MDHNGKRFDPYFKCDWNYHLFLAQNLISHLGAYHAATIKQIDCFRQGYEGSQDYDLALRFIEQINHDQIYHIPRVLYHWRAHEDSAASGIKHKPYALEAARKAISDHLERTGVKADVEVTQSSTYRINYKLPDQLPLVNIIIPTRNNKDCLLKCISSIQQKTSYPNYELLLVNNNSDDPKTLKHLDSLGKKSGISIINDHNPFNFSAINNSASEYAKGD